MSEGRVPFRQRRGQRESRSKSPTRSDAEQQTSVVYDFSENQALLTACGFLVFIAVVAIFGVLLFNLVGNNDDKALNVCGGFSNLLERDQLQLQSCSSTIQGFCSVEQVGVCEFLQANFIDSPFVDDSSVTKMSCLVSSCTTQQPSAVCRCESLSSTCVRENPFTDGFAAFDCIEGRVCNKIADLLDEEQEIVEDCALGVPLPGTCAFPGTCTYNILVGAGGIDNIEQRDCPFVCALNQACECRDLACTRLVDGAPQKVRCRSKP